MARFAAMVAALGGPPDMAEDWHTHLPLASIIGDVTAPQAGHITAIDGQALGLAVVGLGGGRQVETDRINPSVGLTDVVRLGDVVSVGQPLCTLHAASEDAAEAAAQAIRAAITIGSAPQTGPLIFERIT
jgi:thymidine phosphorylase